MISWTLISMTPLPPVELPSSGPPLEGRSMVLSFYNPRDLASPISNQLTWWKCKIGHVVLLYCACAIDGGRG